MAQIISQPPKDLELTLQRYGVGLEASVLAGSLFVSEVRVGFLLRLKVFASNALSIFFSGTGEVGATTSVFCSHAPKIAALASMQINFFIVLDFILKQTLNLSNCYSLHSPAFYPPSA